MYKRQLKNYSSESFSNLLRLATPIGQVNDFVKHPAFHVVRKDDLSVLLTSVPDANQAASQSIQVSFDFFRISEFPQIPCHTFDSYINAGMPRNASVHTIHRAKRNDQVLLSAADIQPAAFVTKLQTKLRDEQKLPCYTDENDELQGVITRGFQLALSGGMLSQYLARAPRSTSAAFRGVILSETARPTLGRKYVMDQRESIPKTAAEHETVYGDIRKKVLPDSSPPPATPAAARWRREFFELLIADLTDQVPLSNDMRVWAGSESREARTMIVYGELLNRNVFGNVRVLRTHLQDKYDFAFLYKATIGEEHSPTAVIAEEMKQAGYAQWNEQSGDYLLYGIGEFKAEGQSIFDDFNEDDPRKSANTIDLLVCWDFDPVLVEDRGWIVESEIEAQRDFQGQTHIWRPGEGERRRSRRLAVVSLDSLIQAQVASQSMSPPPIGWPDCLPDLYF